MDDGLIEKKRKSERDPVVFSEKQTVRQCIRNRDALQFVHR